MKPRKRCINMVHERQGRAFWGENPSWVNISPTEKMFFKNICSLVIYCTHGKKITHIFQKKYFLKNKKYIEEILTSKNTIVYPGLVSRGSNIFDFFGKYFKKYSGFSKNYVYGLHIANLFGVKFTHEVSLSLSFTFTVLQSIKS